MQEARIWFRQPDPPVDLADIARMLRTRSVQIEHAEWTLGETVVPQLRVASATPFLMQIDTEDWVAEEAVEFAGRGTMPNGTAAMLRRSNARLEVGATHPDVTISETGMTVTVLATTFDPARPDVRVVLETLASDLSGVLEDNVNGTWWQPEGASPTLSRLARLASRLIGRR